MPDVRHLSRLGRVLVAFLIAAGVSSAAEPRHATPPSSITLPPGFEVDLLRSAQEGEDSWISMTFDSAGRIIVGLDTTGVARLTPPDVASASWSFERLNDTFKHCRGVLYAHDSLYVVATDDSAFYRLRDRDGDDRFEETTKLATFDYRSRYGHGPNQITLGPDGNLYLAIGNDVSFPEKTSPDSPYRNPKFDRLLPDPRDLGEDDRVGYVARTDPEVTSWTILAGGFRNQVDVAFDANGDMFTWDADMEWDVGLPWYRPTRLNHVVSGGEYGWRWGTSKWPVHYADSLPSNLDTGLGSPTALAFGTESQFPPRFRNALFMADWQHGRILTVTLTPRGATYEADDELFAEGGPLNVCDMTFGPDGHLYFITGGRGSQSGLYRVRYVGPEEPEFAPPPPTDGAATAHPLRHRLEACHTRPCPESLDLIWENLAHADRWVRSAARVALERIDPALWQDRAFAETDPLRRATALLVLVRVADSPLRDRALTEALRAPLPDQEDALLTTLRAAAIALSRGSALPPDRAAPIADGLAAHYPHTSPAVTRELCELLVVLKWPGVVARTLPLIASAASQEDHIHAAHALLRFDGPWTLDERTAFLRWLRRAKTYSGGHLYPTVLQNMEDDFSQSLSDDERTALAPVLADQSAPAHESTDAPARPFVRRWTLADLEPHLTDTGARDPEAGRRALAAANCLKCHRLAQSGSPIGPDLTAVGRRFDPRAIAESIIEPSKIVDPKYRTTVWVLSSGLVVTGRAAMVSGKEIKVETNPLGSETVTIARDEIDSSHPAETSPMPSGLLDTLTLDEMLDLLAFLRAGGGTELSSAGK